MKSILKAVLYFFECMFFLIFILVTLGACNYKMKTTGKLLGHKGEKPTTIEEAFSGFKESLIGLAGWLVVVAIIVTIILVV